MNRVRRAAPVVGLVAALATLGVPPAVAAPTVSFNPKVNYLTGTQGGSGVSALTTAAGDFTGDSRPDVVVLDYYGFGDPVLMVNQGGAFPNSPSTRIPVDSGLPPLEIVHPADFNEDGKLDILFGSDAGIWVLRGNGNGTFTQTYTAAYTQNNQKDAKVDDFNNDGNLDLLVKGPAEVKTWLGTGTGTFTAGTATPYPTGSGLITVDGLATGEFDNDGDRDLAISDALTGKVYTLLGNGAGGFSPAGSVTMTGVTSQVPGSVLVGDYNHDGHDDLATINEFSDTLKSLAVALAKPAGGFNAAVFYPGGINPSTAALADFNRDGNLDVVASDTTGNAQVVQLGQADGTFVLGGKFGSNTGSQTPAVADYNGDGKPDIAVVGVTGFTGAAALAVLINTTA